MASGKSLLRSDSHLLSSSRILAHNGRHCRLCTRANQSLDNAESTTNAQRSQSPNPKRLKLQKIEKLGEEAWAGVAALDKGEQNAETSLRKTVLLASGDFIALSVFMLIGKISHGHSTDLESVLKSTAPFLIGWFGAGLLQKSFGVEAQSGDVKSAALKAGQTWAIGAPVGIAIRSAQAGKIPSLPFSLVTLATTFVLLVGWRSALAAITPSQSASLVQSKKSSKKGNPFEFLQLLGSLTKRW